MYSKKIVFSLATLLMASYSFADPLPAAYTAPAGIDVGRSWEVSVSGEFLLWEVLQDNMELGVVSPASSSEVHLDGDFINNNAEYKPGFRVGLGLGFDHDGWDTKVDYTRFYSTHTTYKNEESSGNVIYPTWLSPQSNTFRSASEKWKVEFNCLDWVLGRTSQFGQKLTLQPLFGLRGLWLDQKVLVHYNHRNGGDSLMIYRGESDSWGIGPEMGISSRWLLGAGFQLFSDVKGDILYTRYTRLHSHETLTTPGVAGTPRRNARQSDLNQLRPHCDLELGLSWGSYFFKDSTHLELSAGYGFQVFWNQNMFRKFVDDLEWCSSISPNGDLYIQGLTLALRADF